MWLPSLLGSGSGCGYLHGLVPAGGDQAAVVRGLNPVHTLDGRGMLSDDRGLVGLQVPHLAGLVTGGSEHLVTLL